MGDFQVILLSERERPIREARPDRPFSLVLFRNRMAKPGIRAEAISSEWLSPHDAQERISVAIGNRHTAVQTLLRRITAGVIQTAALRSRWRNTDHPDAATPTLIPASHWTGFPEIQTEEELAFWQTGDISFGFEMTNSFDVVSVTYFGVRFDPEGIEEIVQSAGGPRDNYGYRRASSFLEIAQLESTKTNKGGRPRKDYWDDLWADICGQIYEGTLVPSRQSDIEKAMLDWATNHGHELSEATARPRARILFNRLKREAKN